MVLVGVASCPGDIDRNDSDWLSTREVTTSEMSCVVKVEGR